MKAFQELEVWFVTGSQHLYGQRILDQVAEHSQHISQAFNENAGIPAKIVYKPTVKTPEEILNLCMEANHQKNCIGLICWMHTFSPSKMWIAGLSRLQKPFMHLHTQFNRDLPWESIDMDFMNLTQSAHGGREFGYIGTRLEKERKVVVGHWQDEEVISETGTWIRAAAGWHDSQNMKIARFGDNMREVAVTEGNKVSAQISFGYSVHAYGLGDLVEHINAVSDSHLGELIEVYQNEYLFPSDQTAEFKSAVKEAARIEAGIRSFLVDGGFSAYTNTFENLHGMKQLPGLATQRLMAEGYGFGAEGDWKTAALLRTMKFMAKGMEGGTSFMEDYTYHLEPGNNLVLGSHMLEVCPSIANPAKKPSLEVHQLGIGGKEDPARLVFDAPASPSINATMLDMGHRFRLLVNEVETIEPLHDMPKLPVARAMWKPQPDLKRAAAAWILAGGAHHTSYSQAITTAHMQDFADMAGVEMLVIDDKTEIRDFKNEMRWNDAAHRLKGL